MKTQQVTVELDDETLVHLEAFGKPADVLARLAHFAAQGVRRPERENREATNESLRVERKTADDVVAHDARIADQDEIVRAARERAGRPVTARGVASGGDVAKAAAVDASAAEERTVRERERAVQTTERAASLAVDRKATDSDLMGERTLVDSVLIDQRDANERMVNVTIRAHEIAAEAEEARVRVERSERELREVAELREMFIAILGHDLRNPLGAIASGAALLLQRERLDEEDAAIAKRIVRASERITRMVTQLLDLTRARLGGGIPIEPTPIDLREICRNVVEEFDAPVDLRIEGDDVTGTWDADRVAEVLSNLIGNAIQYAAPATTVVVDARADGADLVVDVTNRGEPIPADVLPHIFEPFRRAKQGATSTGNLGLGLYIAQQIVLAHGGTLSARSAEGTTTFTMRLPRVAQRSSAARTA